MKSKFLTLILLLSLINIGVFAKERNYQPKFSTAGFYQLDATGREVFSMNPAWRFHKGNVVGASKVDFNDSTWTLCNLPNGIELLPDEASGCVNYQGVVWYRKHFTLSDSLKHKELFLYFEAIMGKSKIWLNGKLIKENYSGYLPIIINISKDVKWNQENVLAVMADNSDDPNYPPGKPQDMLDFTYCGGIYRDVYLISHNNVYITDPNYENKVAAGGLFVSYGKVSEKESLLRLGLTVRNDRKEAFKGKIVYQLFDKQGHKAMQLNKKIKISADSCTTVIDSVMLKKAHLWSPDSPYLYKLCVYVKNNKGKTVDGYYQRIGIRSIEFKSKDGLWINGKPYPEPLMGANRHQDYAVIGNALSNSLHWRDAKKLRDAGLKIIRNAHYPQDPAFMDACDELGLFVIINTPGWQFWNPKPIFVNRVYSDIRNMVRRDRNRPSVFMWEPILNETSYPDDFAKNVVDIINSEYPYPYCYYACDSFSKGHELFPVLYRHPSIGGGSDVKEREEYEDGKVYFTREWGDNVDNWNSHNSPSRVSRKWGEVPMLIQAQHYAKPYYKYTCYDLLYRCPRQHFGGCLWHPFDHQRGYHPDPFYGGIMDNYRQPKLSYYMFLAQRPAVKDTNLISETGPVLYVANAMTPFSPKDVTIYSNCDEVKLQYCKDGKVYDYQKDTTLHGMPSPIICFKNVLDIMKDKRYCRSKREDDYYLLAQGLMNHKVVISDTVYPARRAVKIRLRADNEGNSLIANGSDMMTIVAEVCDKRGTVKRLNNEHIRFSIEGPAELVASQQSMTNPVEVHWGTAPIIIRSTTVPGTIKIKASVVWEGKDCPLPGELIIQSKKADLPFIADSLSLQKMNKNLNQDVPEQMRNLGNSLTKSPKLISKQEKSRLKEVEQQQEAFENDKNSK